MWRRPKGDICPSTPRKSTIPQRGRRGRDFAQLSHGYRVQRAELRPWCMIDDGGRKQVRFGIRRDARDVQPSNNHRLPQSTHFISLLIGALQNSEIYSKTALSTTGHLADVYIHHQLKNLCSTSYCSLSSITYASFLIDSGSVSCVYANKGL